MNGLSALGHEVPFTRRDKAYIAAKEMGLNSADAFSVIDAMSECVRKDRPNSALEIGCKHVDFTGSYRLLATLLTD